MMISIKDNTVLLGGCGDLVVTAVVQSSLLCPWPRKAGAGNLQILPKDYFI